MNEQAEAILIGTILKDNSILEEVTLTPDHFLDMTHKNIYSAMLEVKRKGYPIDGASLRDHMGDAGFMFIGGNKRLKSYKESVPSVHAFWSYEQMILNQWKLAASRDLITSTLNEFSVENVQALITELAKVDEQGMQQEFNLKEHLANMYDLVTVESPKERSGIVSGYKDIDNKTDGWQAADLIIVGARPSMGKTAFMLNLALNAARSSNALPAIFSLEMKAESLIRRMISCIGEINGMKLKNPYHYTNDAEKERWIKALGVIEKTGMKIYDKPRQTVSEMRARLRKLKHEHPDRPLVAFIDYMTLIKPTKDYNGNAHAQVTEISADLKAMAKDFDCPVICLAQLSRGVEQRADKRPMMSDLRESGSIEQDADIIALLYRDEYYNETTEDNRNVLEVDIAKNREGEVGSVKLQYKKDINRIENFYYYHHKG